MTLEYEWNEIRFYLILSGALLLSLILAFVHLAPISLLFWANVLNGVLAPILVFFLFLVGNSRKVMRGQRLSWLTNIGLILTFLLMSAAAVLLFYGLLTNLSFT